MCIRLWLLSLPESFVESMTSVLGEVFGAYRNLEHESAAEELIIRWNGPDPAHADSVVAAARTVLRKKFRTEVKGGRLKNVHGTVIAGRMARKCPCASVPPCFSAKVQIVISSIAAKSSVSACIGTE